MNSSKKFKKKNDDDDVIIIDSPTASAILNEFCQYTENTTGESCREYYSVVCIHCHLSLCYIHVETHRILLINERDQLINELNERIDELNQLIENPEKIRKLLIEKLERQNQKRISFIQQIEIEKLIDVENIILQLKELFQPVRILLRENQSVSVFQIKKIQQTFRQFDENKNLLFNNMIHSIPIEQTQSRNLRFHLSKLDLPCRQYQLPIQRTNSNEMAASENLLLINDREQILLFNLTDSFDETFIPELIPWKHNLDGKILDIHYSSYLKLFFILTDEKFFSFDRLSSSFVSLYRFTSLPWSCTTIFNSIYILYKYSTSIEQWTFQQTSTIELRQQWKLNEILTESEHDQHLRSIRTNPSQTQLAILIEDDECRWRIALFDTNMTCLHQTDTLPNASTIDWNLFLSFISDQQLLIIDATTEHIYLVTIDQTNSSIEYKHFSESSYPVNACIITNNGYSQLILQMIKPNMLKFFQI